MRPDSEATLALRALAESVVGPHDGFYLRPWMSRGDPGRSRVFLVGANAATPFPLQAVARSEYIDALVAGGRALRDLYLRVRSERPSPTRTNIDRLVDRLEEKDIRVLETNVWALPTRSLSELRRSDAVAVEASGRVLTQLIELLQPRVLIVHGAAATRGLAETLGREVEVSDVGDWPRWTAGEPPVVSLPSLSPPRANQWLPRAGPSLDVIVDHVLDRS